MRAGEVDQLGARQQRADAQHHDPFSGLEHGPADVLEHGCRRAFDGEVGMARKILERHHRTRDTRLREPFRCLGLVARRDTGEGQSGHSCGNVLCHLAADRAHSRDRDLGFLLHRTRHRLPSPDCKSYFSQSPKMNSSRDAFPSPGRAFGPPPSPPPAQAQQTDFQASAGGGEGQGSAPHRGVSEGEGWACTNSLNCQSREDLRARQAVASSGWGKPGANSGLTAPAGLAKLAPMRDAFSLN